MQIVFGFFMDGCEWNPEAASLGKISFGPRGMLKYMEEKLCLAGKEVSTAERIGEYMQKIISADDQWCRASFALDKWSTAKQLLAWRDELIEAGWQGECGNSKRLAALWKIEQTGKKLSPGFSDRLQKVFAALEHAVLSGELIVTEPLELLPVIWQKIILRLESCGMTLTLKKTEKSVPPKVFKVTAPDEFSCAVKLARYISAGDNGSTALICENDSRVLDGVLHRYGFGGVGRAESSCWRESMQVLPLWLGTLWKPFNPQRFLELLLLPYSIIPSVVGLELIHALQDEPGIGGEKWIKAWENAQTTVAENKYGYYKDTDEELKKIAFFRNLLEQNSFKYDTVSEKELADRCDIFISRMSPRIGSHPELAMAVTHAGSLKKIIAGQGSLDSIQLARMLDSIISTGIAAEDTVNEVTPFRAVTSPGMLQTDYDTVLWWNCIDSGGNNSTCWTAEEQHLIPVLDPIRTRKRNAAAWRNALNNTGKNLIFFVPDRLNGEAVFPHPFLDEFDEKEITVLRNLISGDGSWKLADREMQLTAIEAVQRKYVEKELDENNIEPRRNLSYTQLNRLLACPFQWFMQDYIGLQMPAAMNVKTGSMMIGTLAHKVVEELFKEKSVWLPDEARRKAGELFDKYTPQTAAELLLDGRDIERSRTRTTLCNAVSSLISEIRSRKLTVAGQELERESSFQGYGFHGYIDLLLQDENGNYFVIDMKWSQPRGYVPPAEPAKVLQLVTYSWLVQPEDMDGVQCAFFLFPARKFVQYEKQEWQKMWHDATATYVERMNTMKMEKLLQKSMMKTLIPCMIRTTSLVLNAKQPAAFASMRWQLLNSANVCREIFRLIFRHCYGRIWHRNSAGRSYWRNL